MEPYSRNGGIIGQKMDFGTTVRYNDPVYVGGAVFTSAGTTADLTYSLTSLTGGIDTVAAPTDLVIAVWSSALQSYTLPAYTLSGFTQVLNTISNFTYGVWVMIGRAWGATSITVAGGTGNAAYAGTLAVHVWRNIDPTTPIDDIVAGSRASALPDPPAITTTKPNSIVIVAGGSGHTMAAATFGSATASNFITIGANSTNDTTVGIGSYFIATPSTYDPPVWTFSSTDSTQYSAVHASIALNSQNDSNYKNSGIWDLPSVYAVKAGV